jgi:LAO/AO transport system kinase
MASNASKTADPPFLAALARDVRSGDRRALARAITLVESTRADHRAQADALLAQLLRDTGKSIRLGITGVPGVGKSTFIERFGLHLIAAGHRVAVLAVDPSSKVSGGSILGDKTRMEELGRHPDAFIRPTPAGATLGGVARRTREAILLSEAAGFDVVIVETVGVGQSETTVSEMVDLFMLLLLPSGGDELQGIKKGVVELADLVVVNKADGDMKAAATRAASEYRHALYLLRAPTPGWKVEVRTCSALTGEGIAQVWDVVERFRATIGPRGIEQRRANQARAWLWNELGESLLQRLRSDQDVQRRLPALEKAVMAGKVTPGVAAAELLAMFTGTGS